MMCVLLLIALAMRNALLMVRLLLPCRTVEVLRGRVFLRFLLVMMATVLVVMLMILLNWEVRWVIGLRCRRWCGMVVRGLVLRWRVLLLMILIVIALNLRIRMVMVGCGWLCRRVYLLRCWMVWLGLGLLGRARIGLCLVEERVFTVGMTVWVCLWMIVLWCLGLIIMVCLGLVFGADRCVGGGMWRVLSWRLCCLGKSLVLVRLWRVVLTWFVMVILGLVCSRVRL